MDTNWKKRPWEWVLLDTWGMRDRSWHIALPWEGYTACGEPYHQSDVVFRRSKGHQPPRDLICEVCWNELTYRPEQDDWDDWEDLLRFEDAVEERWRRPEPQPQQPELPSVIQHDRLAVVGTVRRRCGEELLVGANGIVYRRQTGNLTVLAPFDRFGSEWGVSSKKVALLEHWDRSKCPPDWALRLLHEQLFSRYPHEVMVVNGIDENGNWVFGVPKQRATGAEVDTEPDDGQVAGEMQAAGLELTGFTHCHPGSSTAYSAVDDVLFRKKPGLHPIVSADGTRASIHGSVTGYVWTLERDRDISQATPPDGQQIRFMYSGDRPLDELFERPSVRQTFVIDQQQTGFLPRGRRINYTEPSTTGKQVSLPEDWETYLEKTAILERQVLAVRIPGFEELVLIRVRDKQSWMTTDRAATAKVEDILKGR